MCVCVFPEVYTVKKGHIHYFPMCYTFHLFVGHRSLVYLSDYIKVGSFKKQVYIDACFNGFGKGH